MSAAALGGLRRFLETPQAQPEERCELCAAPLVAEHGHLVHLTERSLRCACRPCWLLFANPGAAGGHYRQVPDRVLSDPEFGLTDGQWDELQIPVKMAFFFRNSVQDQVVACYPSPAGATESELPLDAWTTGVGASRLAAVAEPDVEALLVRRGEASDLSECLLVPIDACYRLVGLVRMHWKGFDGGTDAWREIDGFFDDIRRHSRPLGF